MFRMIKSKKERRQTYPSQKAVMRDSNFYQASPVDVFNFAKHKNPHTKEDSIRVTSDIYMLFNQQRLDRMSREVLIDHFNQMSVRENPLQSLRSKLSDDQLCSIVKSRFIQSPSELMQYSSYLNSLGQSEIEAIAAAAQAQQAAKKPDVNVVPPKTE